MMRFDPISRATRTFVAIATLSVLVGLEAQATVLVDPQDEVDTAIRTLRSASTEARYWATVILGRYPEQASCAVPRLGAMLSDPAWEVRAGAARALDAIAPFRSDQMVSQRLAELLWDEVMEVRAAAAFALAAAETVPRAALPALRANARAGTMEYLRVGSWLALRTHFPTAEPAMPASIPQTARRLLEAALDAESEPAPGRPLREVSGSTAARLARALAHIDPEMADALLPDLADRHASGSYTALPAARAMTPLLRRFDERRVADMRSDDPRTRRAAIRTVGLLGLSDQSVLDQLAALLADDAFSRDATRAVRLLGPAARSLSGALASLLLTEADLNTKRSVGLALIAVAPDRLDPVLSLLSKSEPELAERLRRAALLSRL
jgi:hypothetical protein